MAQKVTRYLIYTLVLSLGFGQLLRFSILGGTLYLHDILIVLILLTQINNFHKITVPNSLKLFGVGLSLGWLFALYVYPLSHLLLPFFYTLRLFCYLILYLLLKSIRIKLPNKYMYLTACITLVIGSIQYLFLPDMRWAQYLGWDDHLSRLTLPHFDPTFTGVMLSLFLLSVKTSALEKFPLFLGILLTYARSVWLSLFITLVIFLKSKKLILLLLLTLLAAILVLPRRFGEGTNLLRTYSITSRFDSDFSYIKKYNWNLFIGRGMNTLILDQASGKYDNHATSPNNSYIYLLLTTGLIGLFGWGQFMFSLYYSSLHKPMLIFCFFSSLFNNVMFYPFALLWILLISSASDK